MVRAAQVAVIRQVAFLIDGYAASEGHVEDVDWQLYELDQDSQPKRPMVALHESADNELEFPADL